MHTRMNARAWAPSSTEAGALGPFALWAMLFLVVASPLMRGGNRHVAMIVLEAAALAFLAAVFARGRWGPAKPGMREAVLALLLLSPAWLALAYLLPLPDGLWRSMPGRAEYAQLLGAAGFPAGGARPLSLAPDATLASLLAGIPLVAAFAAGYGATLRQLRWIAGTLLVVAFLQIVIGLLQIPGGSTLAFGSIHVPPYGTFANKNHYANYLAMALAVYIWFAASKLSDTPRHGSRMAHPGTRARIVALWAAGAAILLIGILMSRSRGAVLAGVPMAILALLIAWDRQSRSRAWGPILLLVAGTLAAGTALVGFDETFSRFGSSQMAKDIPLRTQQASTTLEGAAHFWPVGSGWGTYRSVYPRFQPSTLVGTADHAHQDYAEMLFEGGLPAVLLIVAAGWLAATRAIALFRARMQRRRLSGDEFAAAVCGLGLLGFLLHCFLEFNMHIPANAFLAALLAGVFLRPLPRKGQAAVQEDD